MDTTVSLPCGGAFVGWRCSSIPKIYYQSARILFDHVFPEVIMANHLKCGVAAVRLTSLCFLRLRMKRRTFAMVAYGQFIRPAVACCGAAFARRYSARISFTGEVLAR